VALPINIGTGICTLLFPRFIVPFPKPVVSRLIRDEVDSTEIGFHNWQEIKDKNREINTTKTVPIFSFYDTFFCMNKRADKKGSNMRAARCSRCAAQLPEQRLFFVLELPEDL